MHHRKINPIVRLLLLAVLVVVHIQPVTSQNIPQLFEDADGIFPQGAVPSREIIRERYVQINPNVLPTAGDAFAQSIDNETITLNLFDDVQVLAQLDAARTRPSRDSGYVWAGHIIGDPYSRVILVIDSSGGIVGHVRTNGQVFEIYDMGGVHAITEIAEDRYLGRGGTDHIEIPPEFIREQVAAAETDINDDGSVVDMMVVYTPSAIAQFTDEAQLRSKIETNLVDANAANDEAGVNVDFNLAYLGMINYIEDTTSRIDLSNMTSGRVPNLHELRNEYAADIVSMVVGKGDSDICGIAASIGGTPTSSGSAYHIVRHNCLGGGRTFTHEVGHNMGMRHDLANGGRDGTYSNGYQDVDGEFSTIMAYWFNGNCEPSDCSRIMFWSNPRAIYEGKPRGNAEYADVARALDDNAFAAANYRRSSKAAKLLFNEVDFGEHNTIEIVNADEIIVPLMDWTVAFYVNDTLVHEVILGTVELFPDRLFVLDERAAPPIADPPNYAYANVMFFGHELTDEAGSITGGSIVLYDPNGVPSDFVRFGDSTVAPPLATDWDGTNIPFFTGEQSYGRELGEPDTDSNADWHIMNPTMGTYNRAPNTVIPANDLRQNAIPLTLPQFDYAQTNNSTTSSTDPNMSCAPFERGFSRSMWYTYTATENTRVEFNTFGDDYFDTIVAVYQQSPDGELTELVCNNNADVFSKEEGINTPYAGYYGIESRLTWTATAGETYFIMVAQVSASPTLDPQQVNAARQSPQLQVNVFQYIPDFDDNYVYTPSDVLYVMNRIGSNDLSADVNADGQVNEIDADLIRQRLSQPVQVTAN